MFDVRFLHETFTSYASYATRADFKFHRKISCHSRVRAKFRISFVFPPHGSAFELFMVPLGQAQSLCIELFGAVRLWRVLCLFLQTVYLGRAPARAKSCVFSCSSQILVKLSRAKLEPTGTGTLTLACVEQQLMFTKW